MSRPTELPPLVTWQGNRFVHHNGTVLRGITQVLHDLLFSTYTAERANQARDRLRAAGVPAQAGRRAPRPRGARGAVLGSQVDREVAEWVELAWTYGLGWSCLPTWPRPTALPSKVSRPLQADPAARARWRELYRGFHPYTGRVFNALRARGLFPVAAQVGVGALVLRLGTAVDIVCVHHTEVRRLPSGRFKLKPRARFAMVELKCGYDSNYFIYTVPRLPQPLDMLNDSPFHQHLLQLWLTTYLFRCTFPSREVTPGWILRVGTADAHWHAAVTLSPSHELWILQQLQLRGVQ